MAKRLLEGHGITKRFGGILALNAVDISIQEGIITGVIGPNGAGKTTLFNVLAGTYPPTSGRVLFDGVDTTRLPSNKICKLGIARTFQVPRPFSDMTCYENVKVALINRQDPPREDDIPSMAREILEFIGLAHREQVLAKSLNLVEKKRLEVARAMATNPKMLMLDEVLAGLNTQEIVESLDLIERLRDEKKFTLIWIEHVMGAIMKIAQHIIVLDQGEKLMEGTPDEVVNDPRVIQAYLGQ